jgi:T5SS/PEP-CTERM-associated repeat protein
MTIRTWIGGHAATPDSWNDPLNWLGGGVPLAGDTVIIGSAASPPLLDASTPNLGDLNIDPGGGFTVGPFALNVASVLDLGSIDVQTGGVVISTGNIAVATAAGATGLLAIEAGGTVTGNGGLTFADNGGTITVSGLGALLNGTATFIVGNSATGVATVNNGGIVNAGSVAVGQLAGSNGSLTIGPGGTVRVTAAPQTATFSVQIGNATGPTALANGEVTVSGIGALLDTNGNPMEIGRSGIGNLTISQGGSVVAGTPNTTLQSAIAVGRLGTGSIVLTDPGSTLTSNGFMFVGRGGTGNLLIENQASLFVGVDTATNTGGINIGATEGGTSAALPATVQVGGLGNAHITTGGVLSSQLNIGVGFAGSTGVMSIDNGGTVEAGSTFRIGGSQSIGTGSTVTTTTGSTTTTAPELLVGTGTVTVGPLGLLKADGTGVTVGSSDIAVGSGTGSTGVLTVSGAGAVVDSNGGLVVVGGVGTGTLTVNSGGMVLSGSQMAVGVALAIGGTVFGGNGAVNIGASGTVAITAPAETSSYGMLIGTANANVGGPSDTATGAMTVSGAGALLTSASGLAVGYLANGSLTVSQGGSVVVSTLNSNALAALSIGKQGNGSVTIIGFGSTYDATGRVIVGREGTGTLTVENQGDLRIQLDPTNNATLDIGGTDTTSGTLYVGGSGMALVTSGGQITAEEVLNVGRNGTDGNLTIDNGGLVAAGTQINIGNSISLAAGTSIVSTTGTVVTAGTIVGASGTIDVGFDGALRINGLGPAGTPDIAIGAAVDSAGVLNVSGFGALVDSNGGTIQVGGLGTGTLNINGGEVNAGFVSVEAGGSINIDGGTLTATSITLSSGVTLSGTGTTFPPILNDVGLINGSIINNGTVAANGPLTITGSVTGTGLLQINAGAILAVNQIGVGEQIAFQGGTGTLVTQQTGTIAALISGFVVGDKIDLGGLAFTQEASATIAGGVLTVTSGLATETLNMAGIADGTQFFVSADGNGTDIAIVPAGMVPLHGTHDQYVVANSNGSLYVQDTVAGRDGLQILSGEALLAFPDGTGVFDPTGTAEDVARVYMTALGRPPDVGGLEFWTADIDNSNVPLSAVAGALVASPEFIDPNGPLSDSAFVQRLYLDAFFRAADPAGLQFWDNLLASGGTRGDVVLGFAQSPEFKADALPNAGDKNDAEAFRVYAAALGRAPDAGGEAFWSAQLASGATPTTVAQGFVNSAEFQNNFGSLSAADFVSGLYQHVLHRAGDPGGQQFWTNFLQQGSSQASVIVGFSDSLENRVQTAGATHDGWVFIPPPFHAVIG